MRSDCQLANPILGRRSRYATIRVIRSRDTRTWLHTIIWGDKEKWGKIKEKKKKIEAFYTSIYSSESITSYYKIFPDHSMVFFINSHSQSIITELQLCISAFRKSTYENENAIAKLKMHSKVHIPTTICNLLSVVFLTFTLSTVQCEWQKILPGKSNPAAMRNAGQ